MLSHSAGLPCTPNGRPTGLWPAFREGVELVWKTPGLRWLYILLGAVVLAIMPTFTLVPLLVKTHFGGGAAQVALMEGLSGIGMVAGGLLVAAMAPRRQVSWVLCGFAVSCVALALTALAPGSLFGVAVAWWVISGITFVFGNAPLTALLQTRVPNHLQGRVLSLRNTTMGLAAPVGLALFTPLGEVIGARALRDHRPARRSGEPGRIPVSVIDAFGQARLKDRRQDGLTSRQRRFNPHPDRHRWAA